MGKLNITLKKSFAGRTDKQVNIARALGLHKLGQTVVLEDQDSVRGAIHKIDFMLDVSEQE